MPIPSQAATGGKFDTSQFNATGGMNKAEDPVEILAYQRGMSWLLREIPMMEAFIRAWTNKNVNLQIGPIACTDGDTIYLRPLPLYDRDEPSAKYLAHMWHEVAHVILSQVFEPANSRDVDHAIKIIADREFGAPAGYMWNALEDGRVEDRLYKTAPGARKHIVKDVIDNTPEIIKNAKQIGLDFGMEHLLLTAEPTMMTLLQIEANAVTFNKNLSDVDRKAKIVEIGERMFEHARQTGDMARASEIAINTEHDIGLMMATYLETAGYKEEARSFPEVVVEALEDSIIQNAIFEAQRMEKSYPVMTESTRIVLARARELGFFEDWNPRVFDPKTGEPQIIDWNSLSDEEKQAMRDQLKMQMGIPKLPGQNEAVVVNLPKDLLDEMREKMRQAQQGNDNGQNQPSSSSNDSQQSGESAESKPDASGSNSSDGSGSPMESDAKSDTRSDEQRRADAEAFAENDKDGPVAGSGSQQQSSSERVSGSDSTSSSVSSGQSGSDEEESDGLDRIKDDGSSRDNRYEAPSELKEAYANKESTSSDPSEENGTGSVASTSSGEGTDDDDSESTSSATEGESETDSTSDNVESSGTAQSGWSEEDENNAIAQHESNELARLKRIEKFRQRFGEIEDKIRPPHIDYVTKNEAKEMEAQDPIAQTIKEAMQIEVGEISGAPDNKFLFKQRKMKITAEQAVKAPDLHKYDDVLAGEANRLRAIFKQNKKSHFGGQYEIGSHIKGSALAGFISGEHLKPFDRRHVPKKLDYSVTLLIDQSGSMAGEKIEMARTALAMQATLLDKLAIPFEILGFSTKATGGYYGATYDYRYLVQHDVFKSFDEGWTPEQRAKVMSISINDSNLDGLALSWAWDRMKVRREKMRILMTYSDGQPNPDTANQIKIMKHVINQMTAQGCVAIGVGILSHAPEQLYPKSVYCDDVRRLPRMVTKALEEELGRKQKR